MTSARPTIDSSTLSPSLCPINTARRDRQFRHWPIAANCSPPPRHHIQSPGRHRHAPAASRNAPHRLTTHAVTANRPVRHSAHNATAPDPPGRQPLNIAPLVVIVASGIASRAHAACAAQFTFSSSPLLINPLHSILAAFRLRFSDTPPTNTTSGCFRFSIPRRPL